MLCYFLKIEIDWVPQNQELPFCRTDVDPKPMAFAIALIIKTSRLILLPDRRRIEERCHFTIANDLGMGALKPCHFDCEAYLLGGGRLDPVAHCGGFRACLGSKFKDAIRCSFHVDEYMAGANRIQNYTLGEIRGIDYRGRMTNS